MQKRIMKADAANWKGNQLLGKTDVLVSDGKEVPQEQQIER
jgi:hypothetical protein